MNRQLTVVLVAVVGIVAVAGGAFLFTNQTGGADVASASNDAAAAVEQSTSTSQPSEPTEQPTATDAVTTTESDDAVEHANEPLTADAGENVTTREWLRTALDASGSVDPDGDDANLSYEWTQVAGEEVELYDANTATPEFFPPEARQNTALTFEVTVTDEDGAAATDTVTVFVEESDDSDDRTTENDSDDGNQTDVNDASESNDGNQTAENGSHVGDDTDSAKVSNDTIAQATFDSTFEELSTEDAATVYEIYLRQPDGEWDSSSVKTREDLAQEEYGDSFENLGFDARVDVQRSFDAQFGDTGGALSKDEISQAKWGHDFRDLSVDSAVQITELYDRQPWINQDNEHMPTREQLAYRIYRTDYDAPLDGLTREERLDVEYRYNAQFETE